MKKYLIDTHAFIWLVIDDKDKLSNKATNTLKNLNNELFISIASFWEIAIKVSIDKLDLTISFDELIEQLEINNIKILEINLKHTKEIITLPKHHKDPFDRIIIAQAKVENLTIITKDQHFSKYDIDIFW